VLSLPTPPKCFAASVLATIHAAFAREVTLVSTPIVVSPLESEVSRCKRTNEPLTISVCDLDGFKQVNDRYGHVVGNKALRVVADGLRKFCREYDYVARIWVATNSF
jgi:diguanylate cyclase (GGDEF)-like protein